MGSCTKPLAPRPCSSPKAGLREHFIAFNPREGARSLGEASSAGRRLDLGEQESAFPFFFCLWHSQKKKKLGLEESAPDESTPPPFRSASVTQNRNSPLPQKVAEAKAGVKSALELARGEQRWRTERKKKQREKHTGRVRELWSFFFPPSNRGDSRLQTSQRNERFSHCHKITSPSWTRLTSTHLRGGRRGD